MIYLYEDIDAVKKYYPNIPDDTFMQLIQLDPTYKDGSNSVGKYGKWILNLYKKGTISEEDFSEITPLLTQFTTYKNRVANKDLNFYKTLDDLSSTLAQVIDDDSMLSDRQKLRFRKNVKAGRVSTSAEDDYDVVLDTPNFTVYVPNTHEASMKLGKGTKWCTAHENPDWYNSYTENGYKLYIIVDKRSGELYQYSDKTDDILNKDDDAFNWKSVFGADVDLLKFLNGVSYGFFPKSIPVVRNGTAYVERYSYLTDAQKDKTVKIVIPDGCEEISPKAFYHAEKVESVEIPNSVIYIQPSSFSGCYHLGDDIGNGTIIIPDTVKYIGDGAFHKCFSIDHIKIPKNLKVIENATFMECSSLIWVELPDGITSIMDGAFESCFDLSSINIPNSVRYIGRDVFYECGNLTVYTDNDYVIDYCNDNGIKVRPSNEFVTESFNKQLKIRIEEDTACVASKTSYNDTGLDDNGIYYFGKKPKKPVNWKDIKKDDVRKYRMNEMVKNGIFIPRCPKKELSRKSSVSIPYISLRSPDSNVGTDVTILGSKNEAKQFIVDLLNNKRFPMAASETIIQTYNENPEYYEDDMEEFYYNMSWLDYNEGEALFVESDGKAYVFDGLYADAIEAIKLRNITELIYSDAYEYIVYNAYIVYDDSIEGWRDSVDATDYLDGSFDDYRWKNIKGTYIQIPDWADSWRDVVM